MTRTGLRGLKQVTDTVHGRMNVRADRYGPLLVDNKRFLPQVTVHEFLDLALEIAYAFKGTGDPDPDEATVRHAIEGNFCRCTGYQNIVVAIRHAAETMRAGASATA